MHAELTKCVHMNGHRKVYFKQNPFPFPAHERDHGINIHFKYRYLFEWQVLKSVGCPLGCLDAAVPNVVSNVPNYKQDPCAYSKRYINLTKYPTTLLYIVFAHY